MIISLGVKTNNEVDELMHKVEALGGKVIDEPKTSQVRMRSNGGAHF